MDRDEETLDAGIDELARVGYRAAAATARPARLVLLAVPSRALERNRRVAASVLAGGIAYRLFLWLLPFGLIVGGALGLMDADGVEEAVETGGLPAAVVDLIGDVARAAESDWWWLLGIGVPLLLWAGHTGAKAIHSFTRSSGTKLLLGPNPCKPRLPSPASCARSWRRSHSHGGFAKSRGSSTSSRRRSRSCPWPGLWVLVSLRLPHRDARWHALLPGALVIAIGFQVLHGLVVNFLVPKLEKATTLYGSLGAMTTLLFFMYFVGRLVVTAPVLNSSLHAEIREQDDEVRDGASTPASASAR